MSDYAKLIEEWEKAKLLTRQAAVSLYIAVEQPVADSVFKIVDAERLAAQSVIDALVAALNCEECGGTGRNPDPGDHTRCTSCSPTRELVRGGGK